MGNWKSPRAATVVVALAVALCVAAGLYVFAIRDNPESARGIRVESNFSHLPDGPPPRFFDTGQPTILAVDPSRAGGSISIRAGRLVFKPEVDGIAMGYLTTPDMGKSITAIGVRWVFQPGSGTDGALNVTICRGVDQSNKPIGPCSLNLVLTPETWNFGITKEKSPTEVLASGRFVEPLKVDGATSYEVKVNLDGGIATLNLPNGKKQVIKDPRISQWGGNVATFAAYSNHGLTDSTIGLEEVWAESFPPPA